jgi:ribosome-associated protein
MDVTVILKELDFKAVRSSGPGGQHVNKVSTKVVVNFDLKNSEGLTIIEKERLLLKLASKLHADGMLQLQDDSSRSQHKNKANVVKKLIQLLETHLKVAKERKPTKILRAAIEKRIKSKRSLSEKKSNRRPPEL